MKQDLNDRLRAGTLPADPFEGQPVANEVPRIVTVRDGLSDSLKRASTVDKREYGTFGNYKIDEITGGLRPGVVTLIGADSSFGKSSWAVMIADENIKRGKRCLIVSAEDPESMYLDRLMRRKARIPGLAMLHRRLTREHYAAMSEVVARAEPDPFFIDAGGWKLEKLLKACQRAIVEHEIQIIVFDYIQQFDSALNFKDRRVAVEHIFSEMRNLVRRARPGGIAGVVMSQLTMPDDPKTPPGKYSVRESKSLIHGAEIALIGHVPREDRVNKDNELVWQAGDRMIQFAKIKEGDGTKVGSYLKMKWDPVVACFDTVTPAPDAFDGSFQDAY